MPARRRARAAAAALERRVQALDRVGSLLTLASLVPLNPALLAGEAAKFRRAGAASLGGALALAAGPLLLPPRAYFSLRSALYFFGPIAMALGPQYRDAGYTAVALRGGAGTWWRDAWRLFVGARGLRAVVTGINAPLGPSLHLARAVATQTLLHSPAACAAPLLRARAPWVAAFHRAAAAALAPALLLTPPAPGGGWPRVAPAGAAEACAAFTIFLPAAVGLVAVPLLLRALQHPLYRLSALRGGRLARADAAALALLGGAPALGWRHRALVAYAALCLLYALSLGLAGA